MWMFGTLITKYSKNYSKEFGREETEKPARSGCPTRKPQLQA